MCKVYFTCQLIREKYKGCFFFARTEGWSGHGVHKLTICFRLIAGITKENGLFKDSFSEVNKHSRDFHSPGTIL